MRCCGDREKGPISLEEKWDYVVSVASIAMRQRRLTMTFLEPRRFQV